MPIPISLSKDLLARRSSGVVTPYSPVRLIDFLNGEVSFLA